MVVVFCFLDHLLPWFFNSFMTSSAISNCISRLSILLHKLWYGLLIPFALTVSDRFMFVSIMCFLCLSFASVALYLSLPPLSLTSLITVFFPLPMLCAIWLSVSPFCIHSEICFLSLNVRRVYFFSLICPLS